MKFKLEHFINTKDYLSLRSQMGWKPIKEKQVEKALNNSMINISIFNEDECIGIGRIVGDYTLKGMLTDIIVNQKYRGKGIGKLIVTTLIKELKEKLDEGEIFQLEASPTSGNTEFYIKCGMKHKPEIQEGVYLWINK